MFPPATEVKRPSFIGYEIRYGKGGMGYASVRLMIRRAGGWAAAFTVLLGIAAGGEPQVQPGSLLAPVGPLGHWKGEDGATPKTAVDATGNGHNGTYSAGATPCPDVPTTKFPNPGSIKLDGAAGVITVADSPALRIAGDFTIAFWKRKTANVKDWSRIVGKGNGTQRNFGVWEAPEGDGKILFQMYSPAGQPVIDLWSPAPIAINTWAHVVCTVSVNSVSMWINGALVASGTRNGEPGTSADPLTFGFAGYHAYWAGQVDDVRLYNRALSTNEVLYLAAGNGAPAGPAGLALGGVEGSQATLKWEATTTAPPAGTATVYIVKRSTTAGSRYVPVATSLVGTTFTDTRPDAGATYHYVVTAVNVGGESPASNEIAVTPQSK